ncbi:hypothetical protein C2E23DRAFT_804792 [Lenzites betulinus]|nr:hypothetical protein C2E23DRAFT_804792 [Lenzites betulinus]
MSSNPHIPERTGSLPSMSAADVSLGQRHLRSSPSFCRHRLITACHYSTRGKVERPRR